MGLHLATNLFLGLDYWTWMGVVLLLFVDWTELRVGNKSIGYGVKHTQTPARL